MKTTVLIVVLLLSVIQNASANKRVISSQQAIEEIAILESTYSHIHPGYARYTSASELATSWSSLKEWAIQQQSVRVEDFYLKIQRILTLIRCDHTKANIPTWLAKERRETASYLPFKWQFIEGRGIVDGVATDAATVLNDSDEIVAIDGVSLERLIEQVLPYIPYDGKTHWARKAGVAQSLEFMGGAVDHFGSLLWENSPTVKLTIETKEGVRKNVTVERINYVEYQNITGRNPGARNFKDAVTLEWIDSTTARLAIDTFVNYRQPVDPIALYSEVFADIKYNGAKTLILDLRENGGGSNDASAGLMRFLLPAPRQLYSDMFMKTLDMSVHRELLSSWDERVLSPVAAAFNKKSDTHFSLKPAFTDDLTTIEPHELAFSGELIVLTSNSNASGSAMLMTHLSEFDNVTLIGEPTGGNSAGTTAGVLITLTLPYSKITNRIPVFQYSVNAKNHGDGLGVMPDIQVYPTVQQWRAGEDAVLTKAISLASARQ